MTHEEYTYAHAGVIIDALVASGMTDICICPGSRSTPLSLTAIRTPSLTPWILIDERSTAFFALGIAKSTGRPVGLICTSGTAAAEFFPAVVEAHYSRVPLVVLTADRPPELQDVGAPQAIDQVHLYGRHAKAFSHLPLADGEASLDYVGRLVYRLACDALAPAAGPVHLNIPFREPLTAPPAGLPTRRPLPYTPDLITAMVPSQDDVERMTALLCAGHRGLIVAGPRDERGPHNDLRRLAAELSLPILADPLSGLRSGPALGATIIETYDALLRDERALALAPDVVLRVGGVPTSKAIQPLLARARDSVLIDTAGWRDPFGAASLLVRADPDACAAQILQALGDKQRDDAQGSRNAYAQQWMQANARAREALDDYAKTIDVPFDGRVFTELAALLPERSTVVVGSSMPIRDADSFFPTTERPVRFLANRGANGIDGVVSTALGAAVHADGPVVLVIGDLSFYHDMNGLLAAKAYPLSATIILLNNNGGGIFHFLPQAGDRTNFEALFGTPTHLNFQHAAALYGLDYARAATWSTFRTAVADSLRAPGVQLIEVPTDRDQNVRLHAEAWAAVAQGIWTQALS